MTKLYLHTTASVPGGTSITAILTQRFADGDQVQASVVVPSGIAVTTVTAFDLADGYPVVEFQRNPSGDGEMPVIHAYDLKVESVAVLAGEARGRAQACSQLATAIDLSTAPQRGRRAPESALTSAIALSARATRTAVFSGLLSASIALGANLRCGTHGVAVTPFQRPRRASPLGGLRGGMIS